MCVCVYLNLSLYIYTYNIYIYILYVTGHPSDAPALNRPDRGAYAAIDIHVNISAYKFINGCLFMYTFL